VAHYTKPDTTPLPHFAFMALLVSMRIKDADSVLVAVVVSEFNV
jgi:hypothetical protein